MMRARSSFGCSTSSSSSSFSLPFLTTGKNRMGLKRFNNTNNKKNNNNNNNNNKSSVVSIRAGKKKSSSSSFEQLPELTEDETAKKWAGESNDSPTIVSREWQR